MSTEESPEQDFDNLDEDTFSQAVPITRRYHSFSETTSTFYVGNIRLEAPRSASLRVPVRRAPNVPTDRNTQSAPTSPRRVAFSCQKVEIQEEESMKPQLDESMPKSRTTSVRIVSMKDGNEKGDAEGEDGDELSNPKRDLQRELKQLLARRKVKTNPFLLAPTVGSDGPPSEVSSPYHMHEILLPILQWIQGVNESVWGDDDDEKEG